MIDAIVARSGSRHRFSDAGSSSQMVTVGRHREPEALSVGAAQVDPRPMGALDLVPEPAWATLDASGSAGIAPPAAGALAAP
ncbi:MAG: hypothetical protein JWM18_1323 [Chloroflexi bacterium]|jgi:hypothetical protein|nr:hypothetical protein [Chloroflexota bacterium]